MTEQQACRACDGPLVTAMAAVPDAVTGERFELRVCSRCELGHTWPVPVELGRYYGDEYYGARHGLTERWCVRRRLRWLLRSTAGVQGRLLDFGCGEGTFLTAARARGFAGVGIEPGGAAAAARVAGHQVLGSLDALPSDPTFDVVTSFHSLEHVSDPRSVLTRLHGCMAPQAVLLIAVPNARGLQARLLGRHWLHLDVPRHLVHFGPKSLGALLARTGFVIEQQHHMEIEYDLAGVTQSALDAVLPKPRVLLSAAMRRGGGNRALLAASVGLAAWSAPLALSIVAAGAMLGAGGTLVVVARRDAAHT